MITRNPMSESLTAIDRTHRDSALAESNVSADAAAPARRYVALPDSEAGDGLESAAGLLGRLRLGRDEYCQRLLSMLVLDAPYPKWNTPSHPAAGGVAFLRALDAVSFGESVGFWESTGGDDPVFIDEFDLPKRAEHEKGLAPAWAILTPERLWLVELKTEVASHRADQIPSYLDFGRHYYPSHAVDLTYLTPTLRAA
jgi:hypothetical protein